MLEELQRRNFAPSTISTYLYAVEQFARHFECRPDRLNQTHFRSYQAYLLRERKMRALTVRLHVAALRFFFVKTLKRHSSAVQQPVTIAGRSPGCGGLNDSQSRAPSLRLSNARSIEVVRIYGDRDDHADDRTLSDRVCGRRWRAL
jgi:hypothetical protein